MPPGLTGRGWLITTRALWRVLALVSVPGSIHYVVLPGLARDDFAFGPTASGDLVADDAAWWRVVGCS